MGKSEKGKIAGKAGIFEQLREEHAQVSSMMKRLIATTDVDRRRQLFDELRRELLSHAKSEAREFYPELRQFGETSDLVEESLEDHDAIEQMLDRLRATDIDSEEWSELFEEMMIEVEDHVDQEENELFPLAEKLIDAASAERIEARYMSSKQQLMRQVA